MRQLVEEALFEEGIVRMPDRAPVTQRHRAVDNHMADALVGEVILHVEFAFGRGLVRPDGRQAQIALEELVRHRSAGRLVIVAEHIAGRVQRRAKARQRRRPVHVVRRVFLARPDQLHRAAIGLSGDRHHLRHHVHVQAPAEAAAEHRHFQHHVFGCNAAHLGGDLHGESRRLRRRPQIDLAVLELRGAVDRLHRRMRQVRRAIFGLDGPGDAGRLALHRIHVAGLVIRMAGFLVQLRAQSRRRWRRWTGPRARRHAT
jgi:hypothetical protein